jgi:hypothetical protein
VQGNTQLKKSSPRQGAPGNQQSQLITNLGKGYWPDGSRHPHAFSQVQAPEFLNWVATVFK